MKIELKVADMKFFDDQGNPTEQPADLDLGNLALQLGRRNHDTRIFAGERQLVGVQALELRYAVGHLPTVKLEMAVGLSAKADPGA